MPVLNFSFLVSLIFCPSYSLIYLIGSAVPYLHRRFLGDTFPLVFAPRNYTPFQPSEYLST